MDCSDSQQSRGVNAQGATCKNQSKRKLLTGYSPMVKAKLAIYKKSFLVNVVIGVIGQLQLIQLNYRQALPGI